MKILPLLKNLREITSIFTTTADTDLYRIKNTIK
jgi:hypothetical protein